VDGVVAGVVAVDTVVLVVVVGVVAVVVVAVVVAVVVGVVVAVVVAVDCPHCCTASWVTVEAPWVRSARSVVLTVEGRLATLVARLRASLCTTPQWPAERAEETRSSWLLRTFAWFPESRPAPPPQAAMKEVAKPRPPATSARYR
jgi:hypothetical protein